MEEDIRNLIAHMSARAAAGAWRDVDACSRQLRGLLKEGKLIRRQVKPRLTVCQRGHPFTPENSVYCASRKGAKAELAQLKARSGEER